jgi:hypothetical protein
VHRLWAGCSFDACDGCFGSVRPRITPTFTCMHRSDYLNSFGHILPMTEFWMFALPVMADYRFPGFGSLEALPPGQQTPATIRRAIL